MLTNRNLEVFGLKAGNAVRPADTIAPNMRELEALTRTGVDRIARRSALARVGRQTAAGDWGTNPMRPTVGLSPRSFPR
jgi:hypothetical protein